MKVITCVIPCYNEEGNVQKIYSALSEVACSLSNYNFKFLFIDNASTDTTVAKLKSMAERDDRIQIIVNNRNFGPECSIFHGLSQASGDAVVLLACDLQEPPVLINDFVKKWEEGAKVVWGQKTSSKESRLMYWIRSLYYYFIKKLSSIKQYSHVTGFGLYDKEVVICCREINDPCPIIRNIIPTFGYTPTLIPYTQAKREQGVSSYNLFRYFDTALNSLVHTSRAPLKLAILIGVFCAAISFFFGVLYLIMKLMFWNEFSLGTAPVVICTFFIGAIQLLFLGLLGEYVIAILDRVSFVRHVYEKERINFDK